MSTRLRSGSLPLRDRRGSLRGGGAADRRRSARGAAPDRRASTSAKGLPYGVATARGDVSESLDDETRRTKARIQTLETTALAHEAISMWLGAAVLGPLLDHQHSRFDVLHYFQPVTLDLASGLVRLVAEKTAGAARRAALAFFFQRETGVLETAWWVPPCSGARAW